jgi:hypothetical protein
MTAINSRLRGSLTSYHHATPDEWILIKKIFNRMRLSMPEAVLIKYQDDWTYVVFHYYSILCLGVSKKSKIDDYRWQAGVSTAIRRAMFEVQISPTLLKTIINSGVIKYKPSDHMA